MESFVIRGRVGQAESFNKADIRSTYGNLEEAEKDS